MYQLYGQYVRSSEGWNKTEQLMEMAKKQSQMSQCLKVFLLQIMVKASIQEPIWFEVSGRSLHWLQLREIMAGISNELAECLSLHLYSPIIFREIIKQRLNPIDNSSSFMSIIHKAVKSLPSEIIRTTSSSPIEYLLRFYIQQKEDYLDSVNPYEIYGPVIEMIERGIGNKIAHHITKQFVNCVVEQKNTDFIAFFKKQLRGLLQSQHALQLLDLFFNIVINFKNKWNVELFRFSDVLMMPQIVKMTYDAISEIDGKKYRYLEESMVQHSTLTNLVGFVRVVDNPYCSAKKVLQEYYSKMGLKSVPKKDIVDPLHFLLIRKEYWCDEKHCDRLAEALMVMTDAWLMMLKEKEAKEAAKNEYANQLLMYIYNFLLSTCNNVMIQCHPVQSNMLQKWVQTPNFVSFAVNSSILLSMPWCQSILQTLPLTAITFQNGSQLAKMLLNHFKGRMVDEILQNILHRSIDRLRKGRSTEYVDLGRIEIQKMAQYAVSCKKFPQLTEEIIKML